MPPVVYHPGEAVSTSGLYTSGLYTSGLYKVVHHRIVLRYARQKICRDLFPVRFSQIVLRALTRWTICLSPVRRTYSEIPTLPPYCSAILRLLATHSS